MHHIINKKQIFKNQSVNDTKAYPQLGQVDYELKFLKSVRQSFAQARVLANKLNNIEIGKELRGETHFLRIVDRVP